MMLSYQSAGTHSDTSQEDKELSEFVDEVLKVRPMITIRREHPTLFESEEYISLVQGCVDSLKMAAQSTALTIKSLPPPIEDQCQSACTLKTDLSAHDEKEGSVMVYLRIKPEVQNYPFVDPKNDCGSSKTTIPPQPAKGKTSPDTDGMPGDVAPDVHQKGDGSAHEEQ